MIRNSILTGSLAFFTFALTGSARDALNSDEMKMLQDPGGWEYVSLSDSDSGIQTTHTCFDGQPHPQECSGTLRLSPSDTFTQTVHIHGQSVQRHGTYKLDGRTLAFFDEFGTEDGPYTIGIDLQAKHLILEMSQVRIELELESQYREDMQGPKRPAK